MENIKELLNGANIDKETLARAMREIKKGNIDMEQVEQRMKQMMSASEEKDPHKRLRMKIANKQSLRAIKKPVAEQENKKAESPILDSAVESKAETTLKNRARKLREMQKKYGTISDQKYRESVAAAENEELELSVRAHHRNILELYAKQNKFKQQIDFADMDDI